MIDFAIVTPRGVLTTNGFILGGTYIRQKQSKFRSKGGELFNICGLESYRLMEYLHNVLLYLEVKEICRETDDDDQDTKEAKAIKALTEDLKLATTQTPCISNGSKCLYLDTDRRLYFIDAHRFVNENEPATLSFRQSHIDIPKKGCIVFSHHVEQGELLTILLRNKVSLDSILKVLNDFFKVNITLGVEVHFTAYQRPYSRRAYRLPQFDIVESNGTL